MKGMITPAFNSTPSNERHEVRVRSVLDAVYEDVSSMSYHQEPLSMT